MHVGSFILVEVLEISDAPQIVFLFFFVEGVNGLKSVVSNRENLDGWNLPSDSRPLRAPWQEAAARNGV